VSNAANEERARSVALDQRRMGQIENQRQIINRLLVQLGVMPDKVQHVTEQLSLAAARAALFEERWKEAATLLTDSQRERIIAAHPFE
jgi:hypothetical protein